MRENRHIRKVSSGTKLIAIKIFSQIPYDNTTHALGAIEPISVIDAVSVLNSVECSFAKNGPVSLIINLHSHQLQRSIYRVQCQFGCRIV